MATENPTWLSRVHHECACLGGCASILEDKAGAFSATGNEKVAKELMSISQQIRKSEEEIGKAITNMLSDEVDKGQKVFSDIAKKLSSE